MTPDLGPRRAATTELLAILGIAAVWLAMASAVHPGGEFPLADDWAYASSVRALLARGEIELRPWTPAITLSHTLWGALASLLLGFSAETLRLSMLCLGFVGAVATYGLMRELEVTPALAAVAALTLVVNPLYFDLAGTFMTDVSFLAASTLALWGFARSLRTGSDRAFWFGTAAAITATLDRQIGLALSLGFAFAVLAGPASSRRLRALLPLVVTGVALVAWELFVRARGGPSLTNNVKTAEAAAFLIGPPSEVAGRVLWNAAGMATYLGLFVLPFAIVAASASRAGLAPGHGTRRWLWTLGLALAGAAGLARLGVLMPFIGNIWEPTGIGPATLRDTFVLHLPHLPEMARWSRWMITFASVAGALLVLRLVADGKLWLVGSLAPATRSVLVLLLFVGGLYAGSVLLAPCLDRYWLPVVPILLGVMAIALHPRSDQRVPGASRTSRVIVLVLLAAGAWYSVAGVHDYLAWNRARWAAGDWLLTQLAVPASSIDGGFEWNAGHLYDPSYVVRPDKSWWWVQDDRWLISFGPIAGRRIVRRVPYARWLPPRGGGEILVLERPEQPAPAGG